jgi:hypothetical protein
MTNCVDLCFQNWKLPCRKSEFESPNRGELLEPRAKAPRSPGASLFVGFEIPGLRGAFALGYRIRPRWGQEESMKVMLESRDAPDGSNYWSLTVGLIYEVLGISCDLYRLLDDCDEPILFDPECFKVIDPTEPSHWISRIVDGGRYANPPKWGEPGFFPDWHNRVIAVRQEFRRGLVRWYPETAAERGIT